jgi:predicted esterase
MALGPRAFVLLASLVAPAAAACGVAATAAAPAAGQAVDAAAESEAAAPPFVVEAAAPATTDGEGAPQGGDGAVADAGSGPSPASAPAVACTDGVSDVYVTPAGLPTMDMSERGALVRCAPDTSLSTSDIAAALSSKAITGIAPTTAVDLYRIAYRTYRDDGVPGVSTARVYLPHTPRSLPLPVIAVAHPSEGLAASCTPSQDPTSLEDEALPWAASGFAVIASDYAGLGNGGVQGYFDNHDQAHSMLDSVRALHALLAPSALDDRALLIGYSQGGGAVLAAQGLAKSYGAGANLVGIVVFAAEYFARLNSVQFVTALSSPTDLTIAAGVTVPVVAVSRDYAYAYNVLGPDAAGVTLPEAGAAGIEGALMSLCLVPFGGYIQGVAPHMGDLFDDGFRTSLLGCITDGGGCQGAGAAYYQWLQNDLVAPDPTGAPVLYVQGLSDTIMPPAQEAACNIGQLTAAGVPVQVCTDPPATHTNVVERNAPLALQWSLALLYGGTTPTCSGTGMPACTP